MAVWRSFRVLMADSHCREVWEGGSVGSSSPFTQVSACPLRAGLWSWAAFRQRHLWGDTGNRALFSLSRLQRGHFRNYCFRDPVPLKTFSCVTFSASCLPCSRLRQLSQNEERSAFRREWLSLATRAGQGNSRWSRQPWNLDVFFSSPGTGVDLSVCLCPEQHQALRWNWHIPTTMRILMCVGFSSILVTFESHPGTPPKAEAWRILK